MAARLQAPAGSERRKQQVVRRLASIADDVLQSFSRSQRVLSMSEYLDLFASHPVRHGRGAPHYVRDMFDHYGSYAVERPWGPTTRYSLFDLPWRGDKDGDEPRLVAHERLQADIYRALCNFAREGRANRLLLMHGPNGSAKSTASACILSALENYAQQAEGSLYRFHWIFPSRKTSRGAIGFGGEVALGDLDSYAHLDDAEIDSRLVIELRDHPLFLIPIEPRQAMLDELWADVDAPGAPPEWLYNGELSHKNKQIFEALLASSDGRLSDVFRHVQVERYFISRRYRVGAVTLGPQMTVDAAERQVTADRSLSALPTSLQATTLFEAHGELIDAAGGVLEFSDLLKRPLDAFRYLQSTLETGQVALNQQTVFTNVVMLGSANDIHMRAFREHPEYGSFRGRLEWMPVPYLRSYMEEEEIYERQIAPQLRKHVAPHAIRAAAEFAVLTRMRRPDPKHYDGKLAEIVKELTALEKLVLYAEGEPPSRLQNDERKLLRANIGRLYFESTTDPDYEGSFGASPRVMRVLLFDAVQSADYQCLSPFAVLEQFSLLGQRVAEFDWLQLKPLSGGYHDYEAFAGIVRERLLDRVERDLRAASGMIEQGRYGELFARYVHHVSAWLKGESMRNEVTGKDEKADEKLMAEVEGLLGIAGEAKDHRNMMLSMIAAWAIEHSGEMPRHDEIFPGYVAQLQNAAFCKLREPFAASLCEVVAHLRHETARPLGGDQKVDAERMIAALVESGYENTSILDATSHLLRERYADIVT